MGNDSKKRENPICIVNTDPKFWQVIFPPILSMLYRLLPRCSISHHHKPKRYYLLTKPRTMDAQWSLFSLKCRTFGLGQWSMHRPKQLDLLLICLMWTLPTFLRSNITDDFFLYCKFLVQTIMLKAQKECKPVIR